MDNGTVRASDTAIWLAGSGFTYLTVTWGHIEANSAYGIYDQAGGAVWIGKGQTSNNQNNPLIAGGAYGVYTNGTNFGFYSGRIYGRDVAAINTVHGLNGTLIKDGHTAYLSW